MQVPNLPDGSHDVDGLIAAVNDRTRLVIVNNPNNPTSTSISDADARRIMQAVPSDVLVLFDEAYIQFNTAVDTSVAMDLFREYPNVVVAHTFSKAYGLAGLRIGYAIAPADVVEGMSKVALPFGVTETAQVAAVASLDAQEELDERVRAIIAERGPCGDGAARAGVGVPDPVRELLLAAAGRADRAGRGRVHGSRACRPVCSPARASASPSASPRPTTWSSRCCAELKAQGL